MAENQRVKKRGRRWVVVGVVALAVALLVGAFEFRERPPYEFLHGAERADDGRVELAELPALRDDDIRQ